MREATPEHFLECLRERLGERGAELLVTTPSQGNAWSARVGVRCCELLSSPGFQMLIWYYRDRTFGSELHLGSLQDKFDDFLERAARELLAFQGLERHGHYRADSEPLLEEERQCVAEWDRLENFYDGFYESDRWWFEDVLHLLRSMRERGLDLGLHVVTSHASLTLSRSPTYETLSEYACITFGFGLDEADAEAIDIWFYDAKSEMDTLPDITLVDHPIAPSPRLWALLNMTLGRPSLLR